MITTPTDVTFSIRRFDPSTQSRPVWERFTIPYTAGMTVLDGLRNILFELDPVAWLKRTISVVLLVGGIGLFVLGTWAAIAGFSLARAL